MAREVSASGTWVVIRCARRWRSWPRRLAGGPECADGGDAQSSQGQQQEVGDTRDVHKAAGSTMPSKPVVVDELAASCRTRASCGITPAGRTMTAAMTTGATAQQATMATACRGVSPTALNTPRSWTRSRVAMSTELSTPSATSTATGSASSRNQVVSTGSFPQMAAVVHHAGVGTTAAACAPGVPTVSVPKIGDQPFWAARLAALGASFGGETPVTRAPERPNWPICAMSGAGAAAQLGARRSRRKCGGSSGRGSQGAGQAASRAACPPDPDR